MTFPILEFDPTRQAIIEPHIDMSNPLKDVPERCVITFFREVLLDLESRGLLKIVSTLRWEVGPNPIYMMEWEGERLLVIHPGVGAPLAAGYLEELIAMGTTKFIACGGAGVLDRQIALGHAVILTAAVRDEGTSYHYLPPGREVSADPAMTEALAQACRRRGLPFNLGKAWTTDAPYRETVARRDRRWTEGCSVVEMEAAAFFAVAQFRGVQFGQVVYGGDLVVPEGWDDRNWTKHSEREMLFWLAVDAVVGV
ncbi:MAG TPA: nucleoside phosphorylase [Levilinea sp.]|nr:nucleoside phosphorylase [Levilinea sp.]